MIHILMHRVMVLYMLVYMVVYMVIHMGSLLCCYISSSFVLKKVHKFLADAFLSNYHFLAKLLCNLCSLMKRLTRAASIPIPSVVKKTPLNASIYTS